ncbi:hypothetical protein ACJX0J_036268, partial [Zea mays]
SNPIRSLKLIKGQKIKKLLLIWHDDGVVEVSLGNGVVSCISFNRWHLDLGLFLDEITTLKAHV